MQLRPDWWQQMTVEEAEKELKGFKYHGAGLYLNGSDTLLVVPALNVSLTEAMSMKRTLWDTAAPQYTFYVYNNLLLDTIWNYVTGIPIRVQG